MKYSPDTLMNKTPSGPEVALLFIDDLRDALRDTMQAIDKVLSMAQQHDPTTGFYKNVNPYELLEILQTTAICVKNREIVNKLGGDTQCS